MDYVAQADSGETTPTLPGGYDEAAEDQQMVLSEGATFAGETTLEAFERQGDEARRMCSEQKPADAAPEMMKTQSFQ